MSTLDNIIMQENELIACIKNNIAVTDFTLKNYFRTRGIDKDDLYKTIDNLLYEKRIERVYPKESQVAIYTFVK